MKRNTICLLISLMVLLAGGFTLLAGGAIVVKDAACQLLDGAGAAVEIPGGGQYVTTASGNTNLVCQGNVTPPPGGSAVQFDFPSTGELCGLPGGATTTDWQETVSASGQATLQCKSN